MPHRVADVGTCAKSRRLAVALEDRRVLIVDSNTGRLITDVLSEAQYCQALRFSRDGEVLLRQSGTGFFNSQSYFEVWQLKDKKLLFSNAPASQKQFFPAGAGPHAWSGDLSPDGGQLVLCGQDMANGTAFDLRTSARSVLNLHGPAAVVDTVFTPGGNQILCLSVDPQQPDDQTLFMFSPRDQRVQTSIPLKGRSWIGFARGNPVLLGPADNKGERTITDGASGRPLGTVRFPQGTLRRAVIFGGGRYLAAVSDLPTGDQCCGVYVLSSETTVEALVADVGKTFDFSSDGSLLAISKGEDSVDVWRFPAD
jgi:hypothetical protein